MLTGVPYEITVYTSSIKGAGTSANPFIAIYGKESCTNEVPLCPKAERKGKFEQGSVDRFVLEVSITIITDLDRCLITRVFN